MRQNRTNTLIVTVAVIGFIALAATAFADWGRGTGRGFGPGVCGGPGSGYGQRGFSGSAALDELSDEQVDRLNAMRTEFFDQTQDLRNQIRQKRLELQSELAKASPDEDKAFKLQKEVSGLKNEMAQKRLEQQLQIRKEFPDLADAGYGRGYGKGRGWGMNQSGQGRGYGMRQGGPGYGRGGGCWY